MVVGTYIMAIGYNRHTEGVWNALKLAVHIAASLDIAYFAFRR